MRRSATICEPKLALAGEVSTWKFTYISANSLPKNTQLKFDLLSTGHATDWEIPDTEMKKGQNVIWLELPDQKPIKGSAIGEKEPSAFLFTLTEKVEAETPIVFWMGSTNKEDPSKGNRAQCKVERRKSIHLYVDTKGKKEFKEPEVFYIDIKGNALHQIKMIVPSVVTKNQRFDVLIRFEDLYGNLTGNAPRDTLVELSYEQLRETLTWKLFIPETGFLSLPNFYFNEKGIYRFSLYNTKTSERFSSAPIKCFTDPVPSLYWGRMHGESERFHTEDRPQRALKHFRDEEALQFFALSPFCEGEEFELEEWKRLSTQIAEFNEEDRFACFSGWQWEGDPKHPTLRQFIYSKEHKPPIKPKDGKPVSLQKFYKNHIPKELLAIPSLVSPSNTSPLISTHDREFEPVFEIYNSWSQGSKKNQEPWTPGDIEEKTLHDTLAKNCRFGFIAGGYDKRYLQKKWVTSSPPQSEGLTAIISPQQSREAIFTALHKRSCYATTGERILLGFTIAGAEMGSELTTQEKPGLAFNRHIDGYIVGTDLIEKVEIIRNGKVLTSYSPHEDSFSFTYDDISPIDSLTLPGNKKEKDCPFLYYYIRAVQKNGHKVWGSPIWIDLTPPEESID